MTDSMTDNATDEIVLDTANVYALLSRFQTRGPNREYAALEMKLGVGYRRNQTNYWQYIKDAVDGTGGFADGQYLYPKGTERRANNAFTPAFIERRERAHYDNIAKDVCYASWDQIVQSKDLIVRKSLLDTPVGKALDSFWKDVDRRGTAIMEFNEFPEKQSRMYGTGYAFMDRPRNTINNASDDLLPDNLPYIFIVPTQHLVDWSFDPNGNLNGVIIVEPDENQDEHGSAVSVTAGPHHLRVWTNDTWALFVAVFGKDAQGKTVTNYRWVDGDFNDLGEIPIVPLYNDDPGPFRLIGNSEMIDVARVAQSIYNIDSMRSEILRKCALFLAMPVKDAKDYDSKVVEYGQDSLFVYDGEAGKPEWITPDLKSVDTMAKDKQELVESAYAMAHLRVLVGNIQTKSGFHAEVEFQKTERRIARHAAQLEAFETKIARLFLKYMGVENPTNDGTMFEVTYPREYGVRDIEKIIDRTSVLLDLNLGDEADKVTLQNLFKALYSRKSEAELQSMVDGAVKALNVAKQQELQMKMGGASGGASGQTGPTREQRLQTALDRQSTRDTAQSFQS